MGSLILVEAHLLFTSIVLMTQVCLRFREFNIASQKTPAWKHYAKVIATVLFIDLGKESAAILIVMAVSTSLTGLLIVAYIFVVLPLGFLLNATPCCWRRKKLRLGVTSLQSVDPQLEQAIQDEW